MRRKKELEFLEEAELKEREEKTKEKKEEERRKFIVFWPKEIHKVFSQRALQLETNKHDLLLDIAFLFSTSDRVFEVLKEEAKKKKKELEKIQRKRGYRLWFE